MMTKIGGNKFSLIIPFRKQTEYLYECLDSIERQNYRNYEVILLPDKLGKYPYHNIRVIPTGNIGPAAKRDIGAREAQGEILGFIDDDAYPEKNWLKNALLHFKDENIAAVCGPGVTPPSDGIFQKAGGWVNSLWFGSGGAGTYRFTPQKKRYVDDYPSMNFLIRKDDFLRSGGFDTHFWPGEDTKLCHDLVYVLKKKIIYDPEVLVYHHRRGLFIPHLRQISRYAIHRGHFAKILPATSFKIGYLIPSVFVVFLFIGFIPSIFNIHIRFLYFVIIGIYLVLLSSNAAYVAIKEKSISIAILAAFGILSTHVIYGILFPIGFLKKSLKR